VIGLAHEIAAGGASARKLILLSPFVPICLGAVLADSVCVSGRSELDHPALLGDDHPTVAGRPGQSADHATTQGIGLCRTSCVEIRANDASLTNARQRRHSE
jgi:hypothetical protein